ncbi:MAG: hypothetical protein ABUK01_01270 [Leptospirales bacterium]
MPSNFDILNNRESNGSLMNNKTKETKFLRSLVILTITGLMLTALSCVSYVDTVVPKVKVTVTQSDQMNMNKNAMMGGYAKTIWAATTRYETTGYEAEKVKLDSNENGNLVGYLPVKPGTTSVTVIVWDDDLTNATPYGGNRYAPYSRNHKLLKAKGYFTPCTGASDTLGVLLSNRVYGDNRLPAFGYATAFISSGNYRTYGTNSQVASNGGPSEEVYTTVTSVSPDSSITVDYTSFILPTANHCDCPKPLNVVNAMYAVSSPRQVSDWAFFYYYSDVYHNSSASGWWFSQIIFQAAVMSTTPISPNLTDTASTTVGGACISRIK